MKNTKEAQFVLKGGKAIHPPVEHNGLEMYLDTKGKKNTDRHNNTLLDMSGNGKHGKLNNFAYEKLSGYTSDGGLVFDDIDDTLTMPKLNGIDVNNFTYQLNNNILAFTGDEVKTVKNDEIEVGGRNLLRNSQESFKVEYSGSVEINERYFVGSDITSPLTIDNEYTVSLRARGNIQIGVYRTSPLGNSFILFVGRNELSETEFRDFSMTFRPHKDELTGVFLTTGYNTGVSGWYEVGENSLKLEKGNKATDWTPAPEDLIETTELKGNILGDMEDVVDAEVRDQQSGTEIFTDKADDSVVHVEVDGKSYQHAKADSKNLTPNPEHWEYSSGASYDSKTGEVTIPVNGAIQFWVRWDGKTAVARLSMDTVSGGGFLWNTSYYAEDKTTRVYDNANNWPGNGMVPKWSSNPVRVSSTTPTLNGDTKWIRMQLTGSSNYTPSTAKIKNVALKSGSDNSYEPPAPTPDYPIEIHSLNDFDVMSGKDVRNIISETNMEFGKFNYNTGANSYTERFKRTSQLIPINPSSSYYVWHNLIPKDGTNGIEIAWTFYDVFEQVIRGGNSYGNNNGTFINTPQNARFVKIRFGLNQKSWDNDKYLMVESDVKKSYSPAPEDITEGDNHPLIDKIKLSLNEPLRSVGDVKDRLFRDSDGLWKVERNIYSQLLNGSESWMSMTNQNDNDFLGFHFYTGVDRTGSFSSVMSSHFTQGTNDIAPVNRFSEERNLMGIQNIRGQTKVIINSNILPSKDIDGFRNWLKNNNVRIQYIKTNFSIETLDQGLQDKLNNLRSFQDSNYVYTLLRNEEGGYY